MYWALDRRVVCTAIYKIYICVAGGSLEGPDSVWFPCGRANERKTKKPTSSNAHPTESFPSEFHAPTHRCSYRDPSVVFLVPKRFRCPLPTHGTDATRIRVASPRNRFRKGPFHATELLIRSEKEKCTSMSAIVVGLAQ